ncbi:hypothetical protein IHE44_0011857 [Lamprotornis superbus]|uniref:Uncharacterized protein n=1 Tax=Lamprotornis superbus TaxID=245042 RepID=A0A835NWM3_9PASS|nr:hypothetical protein IHE44_0011857 [Lamprotornis superbus]
MVLFQGSQVLSGLCKLSLLHAFTHIPVHKSSFGIHQVELVVQPGPSLGDGRGVAQHADCPLHLGQVSTRNHLDKLDASLGLDGRDGHVDVLGDNVTPVEHAAGHVLAVPRVTLDHLVAGLKAGVGDLSHGELLVVGSVRGDDGGVGDQREVDARVGHQVGLEFCQVHVQGSIEAQRGRDGGHDLADEAVQVGVGGALDGQVAAADVVDGLVVHHEGTVRVLQRGVRGQDGVVGLHHGRGDLRGWVDGKLQFGLLSIIHREAFHQQGGKSRAGAAAKAVEDQESLQPRTGIGLESRRKSKTAAGEKGGKDCHVLEGAIRLDAMLQAEELPARISYLHSSLANVDRDALTLRGERNRGDQLEMKL